MELKLFLTPKQYGFTKAKETEVLFGGAAGGGKSYGQLIDALMTATRYPGSRQLILRRTYPELEKSLIRVSLGLFPKEIYSYAASAHTGKFANGSLLDFGFSADENDVFRYQSAEYDVIRFDELTHFTEFQYVYMLSRLRGTNACPKQMKSSTNPGGVGHNWVKARFVDPSPPGKSFAVGAGLTRLFLPSKIEDNTFLYEKDPHYRDRLLSLPEKEKRALLYGDWNIFDGQYFSEFRYDLHTCPPFPVPRHWRRYRTIDYGLDRLACLYIAVSPDRDVYVYREVCDSGLVISDAAAAIEKAAEPGEEIYETLAPPDLWFRSQETGKTKAVLFRENGIVLTRSSNDRETGWLALKELLKLREDGTPRLRIFRTCRELCRCLPMLESDPRRPGDVRNEPHELTHAPDALRGFAITYFSPAAAGNAGKKTVWSADMWQDYLGADRAGKEYLKKKYGEPI